MGAMNFMDMSDATPVTFRARKIAVRNEGRTMYTRFGKRALDLTLAIAMLPLLLPVITVLWLLTRRDGGPGFFGHRRVGRNGKSFRCWKIRTMVVDAEAKLQQHLADNPEAAAEWARDHKLTNDPRITRIGNFLRRTSLDELPQIWNVLKGEMSFVGPRPVTRVEMKKYGFYRTAYLSMRPGITGLWQVSGRNDVSYDERVRMDVQYLSDASLANDLKLILGTGMAVLGSTGR
ncbi:Sugar transferase involved in LPS biosynthesis (colanic, teichoic acid) [Salipiger marinus]|uniref:Sugar transferase involved in LPS biosynthesis (Colanic, teichoic acid) n=2 Tax=Salipiger marinus TaxID=555512 RepID=A0A1G8NJB4_9RHOB|nr:Sugar transferase involved in LPS biosynthesis (colanic, teichoic acid) [Salipiger marinus]